MDEKSVGFKHQQYKTVGANRETLYTHFIHTLYMHYIYTKYISLNQDDNKQ